MPAIVVPEDSEMRKRLDEYLGYGRRNRRNMQLDEDIWQRWQGDRLFAGGEKRKGYKKGKYGVKHEVELRNGEV